MSKEKICPRCKCAFLKCPECGKLFKHGVASHCNQLECKKINTPLDCADCGFVASQNLDGTLDYNMNLIFYD